MKRPNFQVKIEKQQRKLSKVVCTSSAIPERSTRSLKIDGAIIFRSERSERFPKECTLIARSVPKECTFVAPSAPNAPSENAIRLVPVWLFHCLAVCCFTFITADHSFRVSYFCGFRFRENASSSLSSVLTTHGFKCVKAF